MSSSTLLFEFCFVFLLAKTLEVTGGGGLSQFRGRDDYTS